MNLFAYGTRVIVWPENEPAWAGVVNGNCTTDIAPVVDMSGKEWFVDINLLTLNPN